MKKALYNILFLLAYPFLLPGFLVRMCRRGGYAARMGDRFALYPENVLDWRGSCENAPVWIHAVSVGEVQVAGQLMREWRKEEPSVSFILSTTSSTGWKVAEKEVSEKDALIYNPLDFPAFVRAALRTLRPRALILTESEIWPNFIWRAKKEGIPVFLINARVSDRSAPRYRAARFFFRDVFQTFSRIFAQSDLDRDRLVAAGADPRTIEVTGSFKFDAAHRNEVKERELAAWIGETAEGLLVGGSTWPGEENILLRAYARILRERPHATLALAPRHFEKADEVEKAIREAGFACVRRSRKDVPTKGAANEVFLADTTGELMGLYGLADVVFVGKSVCAHGSQNMIEPCLCGKPTVVGPNTENFRSVMDDLKRSNAILQCETAQAVEDALVDSFLGRGDGSLGARAAEAVRQRRGVVARCVREIRRLIAVLAVAFVVAGCSKNEDKEASPIRETCPCVKEAVRGIYRVSHALAGATPTFTPVDVEGMSADTLRQKLLALPNPAATQLWIPSEKSWLLVELNTATPRIDLARAMEAVALDSSLSLSFADILANYVGTIDEVLPAFEANLEGDVVPEWFVSRELPSFAWLDAGQVDADIASEVTHRVAAKQETRRLVLRGAMAARRVEAKGDENAATELWAQAFKENPRDTLLNERLEILARNAKGFLEVGKVLPAMKCYETMIRINPNSAPAVRGFGLCLQKIGRLDVAKKVLARADELEKATPSKPDQD